MLRKVKSTLRRRALKKFLHHHGKQLAISVVMGVLADVLTEVASSRIKKRVFKKIG